MAEEEQQEVYESVVVQVEETERFGQSLAMAVQRLGREEALKMVQQYFEEGIYEYYDKTCRATYIIRFLN